MARELESYRDILEDLLQYTNGRRLLTIDEVCGYLGICYKTAKKRFDVTRDGISAPALARKLARLSA